MARITDGSRTPLVPLSLSLFDSSGIDESIIRNADVSDLGAAISDSLENPGAMASFAIDNPGVTPIGIAQSLGGVTEKAGEVVTTATGLIEHFDSVAMAYNGALDLEERLSKQFSYSTLASGQLFDNELAMGGTIDTGFRSNFVDNALVKGFLYVNTAGSIAVQNTMLGGLVNVDVNLSLTDFDFGIDNVSVDIDYSNVSVGSVLALASGVSDLFGAPPSLVNFLAEAAQVVELVTSIISVTSAASSALFGAALSDPEPVSKVILSVISVLVSIFNALFGDDGSLEVDRINNVLSTKNTYARLRNEAYLREKYLYEFSSLVAPYTLKDIATDAVLQIYLDGTNLAVSMDFTRSPGIETEVVTALYALIQGITIHVTNPGKAYSRQMFTFWQMRNALAKQVFTGGYYVR